MFGFNSDNSRDGVAEPFLKSYDTRTKTNFLKGVVILAVVIVHWNQFYGTQKYEADLVVFVQGLLAMFFVLSGYGIRQSFDSRFSRGKPRRTVISKYYFDRVIKLYPLFWLALLITPYLFSNEINGVLNFGAIDFNMKNLAIFLGAPFYRAPKLFWFITNLIQCYLLAPLLYFLLKRTGEYLFLLLNLLLLSLLTFFSTIVFPVDSTHFSFAFAYKFIFFGHIIAFALGMIVPELIDKYGFRFKNNYLSLLTILTLIIFVYLSMYRSMFFEYSGALISPFMIITTVAVTIVTLVNDNYLPLNKSFSYIGKYSYPIYLFHFFFFISVLGWLEVWHGREASNILGLILGFPFFVFGCALLQKSVNKVNAALDNIVFKRY